MRTFQDDFVIRSCADLKELVAEMGFVPFFENSIPGFSLEEHIDRKLWFTEEEGPWEWKGPVIRETGCAYGKFFEKKAVYISKEWFADFANYRRYGYDFDARFDDELASFRDKELFDLIEQNAPALSKYLKKQGGYVKGGKKGFDTIVTRLQHQCYVLISDFVYEKDRFGHTYGWGVAEYSTPELFLGESFSANVYAREPEESRQRVLGQLKKILPGTSEEALAKILKA